MGRRATRVVQVNPIVHKKSVGDTSMIRHSPGGNRLVRDACLRLGWGSPRAARRDGDRAGDSANRMDQLLDFARGLEAVRDLGDGEAILVPIALPAAALDL